MPIARLSVQAALAGTLLPAALLLGAASPPSAPVTVAVSGVGAAQGRVRVDICTPKSFTHETCPYSGEAAAKAGTTIVTVPGVPPGTYAAQAYWDRNGNGKGDRNMVGMPTELVGFSRDPKVGLSRPKFSGSAFEHGPEGTRIAFSVRKIP